MVVLQEWYLIPEFKLRFTTSSAATEKTLLHAKEMDIVRFLLHRRRLVSNFHRALPLDL